MCCYTISSNTTVGQNTYNNVINRSVCRDPQKPRDYVLNPEDQAIMADATGIIVGTVAQPDDVLNRDFWIWNSTYLEHVTSPSSRLRRFADAAHLQSRSISFCVLMQSPNMCCLLYTRAANIFYVCLSPIQPTKGEAPVTNVQGRTLPSLHSRYNSHAFCAPFTLTLRAKHCCG